MRLPLLTVAGGLTAILVSACGSSHSAQQRAFQRYIEMSHSGQVVAHQPLPEGGTLVLLLQREIDGALGGLHSRYGPGYDIAHVIELRRHGRTIEDGYGSGVPLKREGRGLEPGGLRIAMSTQCGGGKPLSFAYGVLRNPEDTVTASPGAITFTTALLPPKFRSAGEAVYALITQVPTEIVVHAPDRQVLGRQTWGGLPCSHRG